jgi:hypothetical protein
MWAEAAKALAAFPEGVVTAVDPDGYPVSVRQAALRYDAATGEMPVAWPQDVAVTEGPADVLCHYHDEKLWNIRAMQIKGRLERRGNDWVFISSAFTPPFGMLIGLWRAAKSSRAAGKRYLHKRGLERPAVNWAALKEIHRRAQLGQQSYTAEP